MRRDTHVEHDLEYLYEEFDDEVSFDEIPPEPGRSIHANSRSLTVQVNKELFDQSVFCETDERYGRGGLYVELADSVDGGQSSSGRQCSSESRTVREKQSSYERQHNRSHERESRQGGDERKVIGMGVAIGDRKDRHTPSRQTHRTIQTEPGRMIINAREDETISKPYKSSKYDHIHSKTNSGLKDRKRQSPPLDNPTKRRRLDKPKITTQNSRSAKSSFERLGPAKKKSTERPLNMARSSATIHSTRSKSPERKDSPERQRNPRTRSDSRERRLVSSTAARGTIEYPSSKRQNSRNRRFKPLRISKYVDPHPDHIEPPGPPELSSIEKNLSGMIGNLISQVLNEPDIKNMITSLQQHDKGSLPLEHLNMSDLQDTVQGDRPPTHDLLTSDSNIKASIKNIFAKHDIPWRENLSSKRRKTNPILRDHKQKTHYYTPKQDIAHIQSSDVDMDISDSEYTEQQDITSDNDRVPTSSASNITKSGYDTQKDFNKNKDNMTDHSIPGTLTPLFPEPIKKVIDIYRYCATCKIEFQSRMLKEAHLQTDLHLMVTDLWWKTHAPPPKIITKKDQLWCIICHVRINIGGTGSAIICLSMHLKGSMHKNNRNRWKGIFKKLPLYEWCFWKDLDHKKMKVMDKTYGESDTQKVPAYTFVERCIPK